jgi:hypothetical protein
MSDDASKGAEEELLAREMGQLELDNDEGDSEPDFEELEPEDKCPEVSGDAKEGEIGAVTPSDLCFAQGLVFFEVDLT